MRRAIRSPGALPLALLCVAFAGLAAAATLLPLPTDEVQTAAAAAPAAAAAEAAVAEVRPLPGFDHYADITARPIFRPTRRPPEPVRAEPPPPPPAPVVVAPPPPPPPPIPLPLMTLVGIVIDSAGGRTALLQAPNQPATLSVKAGDSIDGWQLAEVRPDGILFRRGNQQQEVTFRTHQDQPGGGGGRPLAIGTPGNDARPAFAGPTPIAPAPPQPAAAGAPAGRR
jgi:hypothetical protein